MKMKILTEHSAIAGNIFFGKDKRFILYLEDDEDLLFHIQNLRRRNNILENGFDINQDFVKSGVHAWWISRDKKKFDDDIDYLVKNVYGLHRRWTATFTGIAICNYAFSPTPPIIVTMQNGCLSIHISEKMKISHLTKYLTTQIQDELNKKLDSLSPSINIRGSDAQIEKRIRIKNYKEKESLKSIAKKENIGGDHRNASHYVTRSFEDMRKVITSRKMPLKFFTPEMS